MSFDGEGIEIEACVVSISFSSEAVAAGEDCPAIIFSDTTLIVLGFVVLAVFDG